MEDQKYLTLQVDKNREPAYPLHHTAWIPNHYVTHPADRGGDVAAVIASADEIMYYSHLTDSEGESKRFLDSLQAALLANGIMQRMVDSVNE